VSSRGLPAFQTAVLLWISVQRCRCRSVALPGLWNTLPRASNSAAASSLRALRHLRQPRVAANLRGESFRSYIRSRALAGPTRGAVRAVPA